MKRCPQCGAEYDDHVEFCFVDGSELVASAAAGAPLTGVPAVPRATPPPPAQQPTTSRGTAVFVVVLLLFAGVVLVGGIAVAAVFLTPRTPEVVEAPKPVPQPVQPVPPPPPPAPTIAKVGFTSTPDQAELWEGETLLCTTPCTVDHPDHAPVPREFVLKLDGWIDTPFEMLDPSLPQHVELKPRPRQPRPVRPTAPKPDIVFER